MIDYKELLIETVMRTRLMFPLTEKQDEWYDLGHDAKTFDGRDYFERLYKALEEDEKS